MTHKQVNHTVRASLVPRIDRVVKRDGRHATRSRVINDLILIGLKVREAESTGMPPITLADVLTEIAGACATCSKPLIGPMLGKKGGLICSTCGEREVAVAREVAPIHAKLAKEGLADDTMGDVVNSMLTDTDGNPVEQMAGNPFPT